MNNNHTTYKIALLTALGLLYCAHLHAQPFTQKYLMAFHTCNAACTGFQDHIVQLAQSDNGADWTLVPGFPAYSGSVPDVIIRNEKLYIFTPGKVRRYNRLTNSWDVEPQNISVTNAAGTPIPFVDPSAMVDDAGNLVLFFLNSANVPIGQDPASCNPYPCTKYFDSAVEIPGSDGTQFILQSGHRLEISLISGTASDPDIFFDGTSFILYISRGGATGAYQSSVLHGAYNPFPALPGSSLLTAQGGIPCGIYDTGSNMYWTFVHSNMAGNTVIRKATHSNFNTQLTVFNTVVSGPIIGQPASTKTESPGICLNTFLTNCTFTPVINGSIQHCSNTSATYWVPAGPSGTIYNWTVTGGVITSPLPYSNTITVLWSAAGGGTVNVEQIVP